MARGKKKESALTPEEKLAQALVPDWEQPYKVPGNWRWTILKACCKDAFSGKSPKYSKEPTDIRIIGQQANRRDGIDLSYVKYGTVDFAESQEDRMWLRKNDVLLNTLGSGTIGRSGIYKDNERLLTDGHLFVFRSNECYLPELMYYYLCANEEQIIKSANGSTNQKFLSLSTFSLFPLPVPPIAEQQRIVDRVEYLFGKLDEAKEKAQSVLDSFETRKAAILHKAFTGELIGKDNAEEACLESIVETIRIGPFGSALHKEDYVHNGVPVVNPKHITGQQIIPEDKVTISYEKAAELASYKLKENDIVLGRRGEMGRSAPVAKEQTGWICGTGSMIIRLKPGYDASFYSQIISSQPVVQYLEKNSVGSTLKNLNEKIVRKIPIPNFSLTEQKRTIGILNSILLKEQQAEEAAEAVLEKIDLLKKSILARAFRGELGTNVPTEESALELLKTVL